MDRPHAPRRHLSERDLEILRDVVYSYIVTGEPVSSRTVAKTGRLGLSSASIRNVMADLEDSGLLAQPHTSAGRVPTPEGYRLYISNLMTQRSVTVEERRLIDEAIDESGTPLERLSSASHVLSELSRQVGVVIAPVITETRLEAIDFVPLSGRRILCVVVTAGGIVESKVVESREAMTREELQRAANYVTASFAGRTVREVRDRLLLMLEDERAAMERWLRAAVELAGHGLAGSSRQNVYVDGATGLLAQPEFADLQRARRLLDTFADTARLAALLSDCMQGDGVRVFLGEESNLTSELDVGIVTTHYGRSGQVAGRLAVVGPARMEYSRVIPLVEYLADRLTQALADTFDG